MSRHDSQPPHPDWVAEARPCPCFERPEQQTTAATGGKPSTPSIPANITLGTE